MKYINLPKPHGFLIWRGKQKAIGLPIPVLSGQKVMVISDGEAYGEAVFGEPVEMMPVEFAKYEEHHLVRPEDSRLLWPNADKLYTQWIKNFEPYEDFEQDGEKQRRIVTKKALHYISGDEVELVDAPEPTADQKELLTRAERLPKTIVLFDEAVTLEDGKAVIKDGCEACQPVLDAVLNGAKSGDASLPLYQLTLTRVPRLALKKKEAEVMEGEKCGPDTYMAKGAEASESEKAKGGYLVSDDTGDHLPTETDGKVDHRLMGAAFAALTVGYRGQTYKGPNKAAALAKLKKLYKAEGMDLPSEKGIDEVGEDEKAGRKVKGSMMDKIKAVYETLKDFVSWAEPAEEDDEDLVEKAFAIKRINGKPIIVTYSTNAFKDREGEIFSTKSLETYVAQAEAKGDRGTYDFWHIPGTDFAVKGWQAVAGKFLVEAGSFADNEAGHAALKFFEKYPDGHPDFAPEGWGCSPKYRYLPEERKSGIYENIWISKTSVLPRLAAANIWTEGGIMALTEQQEKSGKVFFGEELYTKLIGGAEDKTKKLQEAGVANKSVDEAPPTEEKPNIMEQFVQQLETQLQPFVEAMNVLAKDQLELKELIATQAGEIKQLKIAEAVKQQTQMPRATLFTLQRATEAQKTVIAEDDPLNLAAKNIPVQTPVKDTSGAAHFFPPRG